MSHPSKEKKKKKKEIVRLRIERACSINELISNRRLLLRPDYYPRVLRGWPWLALNFRPVIRHREADDGLRVKRTKRAKAKGYPPVAAEGSNFTAADWFTRGVEFSNERRGYTTSLHDGKVSRLLAIAPSPSERARAARALTIPMRDVTVLRRQRSRTKRATETRRRGVGRPGERVSKYPRVSTRKSLGGLISALPGNRTTSTICTLLRSVSSRDRSPLSFSPLSAVTAFPASPGGNVLPDFLSLVPRPQHRWSEGICNWSDTAPTFRGWSAAGWLFDVLSLQLEFQPLALESRGHFPKLQYLLSCKCNWSTIELAKGTINFYCASMISVWWRVR